MAPLFPDKSNTVHIKNHKALIGLRFAVYSLGFFLFFLSVWINKYFGKPTLEQILYHLSFGSEGLIDTDPALMYRFFKWCIALPILFACLVIVAEKLIRSKQQGHTKQVRKAASSILIKIAPFVVLAAAFSYWINQVSAISYLRSGFGEDYFARHYVFPQNVQIKKKAPKNLVLIYVESLEASYRNPQQFGTNLLSSLDTLDGVSFQNYQSAPGTEWTIAGIVSTQCGTPLKNITVFGGNRQGENLNSFLPGARCLTDILEKHGYHNVFMGGASLNFAGKGKFLRDHSYHEIYGREEWINQGFDRNGMNGWGLYDDDLFSKARKKLQELHASKKPFNLTLLTVDTHHPRGFLSKKCAQHGNKGFEGIVKCTAEQISEFVHFIKSNGYLADTSIVIIGDHLAMRNTVSDKLSAISDRRIYNRFISADIPKKNREDIIPFDMFPTLLEFIGMEVEGNQLGLGYSAFSKLSSTPSPNRLQEMQSSLLNRSEIYSSFWRKNDSAQKTH